MDLSKNFTGSFLIAEPNLYDPNFYHTVIFLIQHTQEGALGFILNRILENPLKEVIEDITDPGLANTPMGWGGPVHENYLFVLHNGIPGEYRSSESIEPEKDVIFEPNHHLIKSYLHDKTESVDPEFRLLPFAGCSGWGPGQLERELSEKIWTPLPFNRQLLFGENKEELWKEALRTKGGIYSVVAATGYKPSLN